MGKEKGVTTSINVSDLVNLNEAEKETLVRQLLSSMGVGKEVQILSERHNAAKERIEFRAKEIDTEVDNLRKSVEPINARIAELLTEKRNLGLKVSGNGDNRTRVVTACPDCGQGRHADNDATKGCKVYPGFVAAVNAAKEAKTAVPTFAAYLEKQVQ